MDEARDLAKLLGAKSPDDWEENEWYGGSGMREIVAVADYDPASQKIRMPPDIPVQLIFCNWRIRSLPERFDFGLCRIMFDGKEIIRTPEYKEDANNKVFRLMRTTSQHGLERSVERYARWKPRYPEHEFTIGCVLNIPNDETVSVQSFSI